MTSLLVCPSGGHQPERESRDAFQQVFQGIEIKVLW